MIVSAHRGDDFWRNQNQSIKDILTEGRDHCVEVENGLWLFHPVKAHAVLSRLLSELRREQITFLQYGCTNPSTLEVCPSKRQIADTFFREHSD